MEALHMGDGGEIMYITSNNMHVVPQTENGSIVTFQENFMECQVTEEVIIDEWVNNQGEERMMIPVGEVGAAQQIQYDDDMDVPVPTDQNEHIASHPYPCDFCSRRFRKEVNLVYHMVAHQTDRPYGCNMCGAGYIRKGDLITHSIVHTYVPDSNAFSEIAALSDVEKLVKKNKPGKSEISDSEDHFKMSSRSYYNVEEDVWLLSHRNKTVQCNVCGEDFPDGRSLMNHRHSHSNISGRQFPCHECGKPFGSRSSRQTHIRIHTGERPYGCRFCRKAFADRGTLCKHERIHTGEKPYACVVCSRAFNQRVSLREHIGLKHSGPDPQYSHSMTPYCCQICNDMFFTSGDLVPHLIDHCDLSTTMKRQSQVGPRKYKRRRKLKPQELALFPNTVMPNDNETFSNCDKRTTPGDHGPLEKEKSIPNGDKNCPRTKNISYHVLQAENTSA